MNRRLLIIGIDSLDPEVVLGLRNQLPVLSRLMDGSPTFRASSVFPADTIPAWVSIYTGLLPANHGIFYSFDLFDPERSALAGIDSSRLQGSTFWDSAGRAGLRSVIVQPMLIYPGWPINGILISRSPVDHRRDWIETECDVKTHPPEVQARYGISPQCRSLWGGYPGHRHLMRWAEVGLRLLEREKQLGLALFRKEPWDLFFIYFPALDIIQHRLWRFYDPGDPTFPGENPLGELIPRYYRTMDTLIGEFLAADPDAGVIVMSDHGHGRRPARTVNLNEFLRMQGLLRSDRSRDKVMAGIRNAILAATYHLGGEELLIRLSAACSPVARYGGSLYSGARAIQGRSRACLSTFAGIKSYPHGGIEINREGMPDADYEQVRQRIIDALRDLTAPDGTILFDFIGRREEVAPGQYTRDIFPDLLFRFREGWGVGWDLHSGLFGRAHDHRVASGGHTGEAVMLLHNLDREPGRKGISITDLTPTILDHFRLPWRDLHLDGKSIFGSD